ncbi:OprD family outer membrane porin [Lysobacter arvi]|uniref:OprD family outer membrane porin n=1 Tax=Lysobacter arvi TaxID=3038776 RepID=A0ABU1CAH3_9GAMM|nr:OprD family outer membrane porin [Lysobacter arvi]MDR0182125.1 OprD family outer membrane porin [Lysobacter arvi]
MNANHSRRSVAAVAAALGWALAVPAFAQTTTVPPSSVPAEETEDDVYVETQPTSTEQGQTRMNESFAPRDRAQWVRDTRRKAFQDTKWDLQVRSFYLDREKYDDTASEAWALGGSLGFKTGYFRERFAFGATGYTSQKLYGPEDRDGTLLLAPGQEGYTVLGEVYGEFLINEGSRLTLGRRGFDTPYINRNDARMTPNTFQTVLFQGLYGGDDGRPEWRVGGGYVDKIKERNSEDFVSMSRDAGAPAGTDRGVYALGANYKAGDFSIGAINYYSDDIINIFYAEGKYGASLGEKTKLTFALQYSDQTSVGDDLLRGTDFSSDQWGAKAELSHGGAMFTAAYTRAGGDTNMQNPWSGYPGFTSVQVEDFNRDGESAWMLRAGYTLPWIKGASVYALYVDGSDPQSPTEYAKDECDVNFQWAVADGFLKGLLFRMRYAHISQEGPVETDLDDFRLMIYYDPPAL